tara:strand:+ start:751 stop:918 length:168 start_codon:yes stop_codon:yes gene_type:complete
MTTAARRGLRHAAGVIEGTGKSWATKQDAITQATAGSIDRSILLKLLGLFRCGQV